MDNAQENEAHNLMIAARMNYANAQKNAELADECARTARRNLLITIGNVIFGVINLVLAAANLINGSHH